MTETAAVPHPFDLPEAWDVVTLIGDKEESIRLPGVASVDVPTKPRGVEKKKGAGTAGETINFTGAKSADVMITLKVGGNRLTRAAEFAELKRILPLLEASKKGDKPWRIVNAATALRSIDSIVIADIKTPAPVDGVLTVTMPCFQQLAPVAVPGGTAKGGGGQATICAKLKKDYEAMAKGLAIADTPDKFAAVTNALNLIQASQVTAGCFGPGVGGNPASPYSNPPSQSDEGNDP